MGRAGEISKLFEYAPQILQMVDLVSRGRQFKKVFSCKAAFESPMDQ